MGILRLGGGLCSQHASVAGTSPPDEVLAILGPMLTGGEQAAIDANFATYEANYKTASITQAYGGGTYVGNGWTNFQHTLWTYLGSPGLATAGANYGFQRELYAYWVRYKDEDPTFAAQCLSRANTMTAAFRLAIYPDGISPPHQELDCMAINYLLTGNEDMRTMIGTHADVRGAGVLPTVFGDNTNGSIEGRTQARAIHAYVLAWYISAPSVYYGSWRTKTEEILPLRIADLVTFHNYNPSAAQTDNDTTRILHAGTRRSSVHDYYEKPFQDALLNDALIQAYRLCTFLTSDQKASIVTMVKNNADWMWHFYDHTNKCFPYLENGFFTPLIPPFGEGNSPAPDADNMMVQTYLWLYYITGDVTWRTRATIIRDGALNTLIYSTPALSLASSKQFTEHYNLKNAGYYHAATPLATPTVPVNTVLPVISGTTTSGSLLTVTNGTWTNTPTSHTYRWMRMNRDAYYDYGGGFAYVDNYSSSPKQIGTGVNTYTLVAGDVGYKICCSVVAANASGNSVTALAAKTAEIT